MAMRYQTAMVHDWLRDVLERKRVSQADLARDLSAALNRVIDRSIINKMVQNRRKITADELQAIEIIVGEKAPLSGSIAKSIDPEGSLPPNANVIPLPPRSGRMIPVYGQAVGGPDGEFSMNGNRIGMVIAPPALVQAKDAYAVIVTGESMEPRYFDGETVYVDPHARVVKGDFVVVQIQLDEHDSPKAYVKRFIRHNDIELVLTQYNPDKELRFPHSKVVTVHKVVPWN